MGVTVSSLVSLSLEPPLVGVSIGKDASCYELVRRAGAFGGQPARLRAGRARPPLRRRPARRSCTGRASQFARAGSRRCSRARSAGSRRARAPSTTPATTRSSSATSSPSSTARRRSALMYRDRDVPRACDRRRRLRPRRRAARVGGSLGRGARGVRARARRPVRRRGPARDDGHELDGVVALPARDRAASPTSRRRSTRRSCAACSRRTASTCRSSPARSRRCERLAARFPLGLASSSNRELIDTRAGAGRARPRSSSRPSPRRRSPHGKPAPDVYLEAARRLGVDAGAVRRGRGLARRHPLGEGGRHARRRDPEPELSARRRGARATPTSCSARSASSRPASVSA